MLEAVAWTPWLGVGNGRGTVFSRLLHRLRGRPLLSLQLLLQRVEEAPVGALGHEFLRRAPDHPSLLEAQRIEAHRILRVVLTPLAVDDILYGLAGVVVVGT